MKTCKICGEDKPLTEYSQRSHRPSLQTFCKSCEVKKWNKWNREDPFGTILRSARNTSKNRHREDWVLITKEDMELLWQKQQGNCYYTGKPMSLEIGVGRPDAVSMDRLDSCKGYVEGNVVLCHKAMNFAKNTLEAVTFKEYLASIGVTRPEV